MADTPPSRATAAADEALKDLKDAFAAALDGSDSDGSDGRPAPAPSAAAGDRIASKGSKGDMTQVNDVGGSSGSPVAAGTPPRGGESTPSRSTEPAPEQLTARVERTLRRAEALRQFAAEADGLEDGGIGSDGSNSGDDLGIDLIAGMDEVLASAATSSKQGAGRRAPGSGGVGAALPDPSSDVGTSEVRVATSGAEPESSVDEPQPQADGSRARRPVESAEAGDAVKPVVRPKSELVQVRPDVSLEEFRAEDRGVGTARDSRQARPAGGEAGGRGADAATGGRGGRDTVATAGPSTVEYDEQLEDGDSRLVEELERLHREVVSGGATEHSSPRDGSRGGSAPNGRVSKETRPAPKPRGVRAPRGGKLKRGTGSRRAPVRDGRGRGRASKREDGAPAALLAAARRGDVRVLQSVLRAGIDLDAQDPVSGDTALHVALTPRSSGRSNVWDVVSVLLEAGASTSASNHAGQTPLHLVAMSGSTATIHAPWRTKVARELLSRGAEVNARDSHDQTPLHRAAFGGNVEVAQVLVQAGADTTARDRVGASPGDIARKRKKNEVLVALGEVSTGAGRDGSTSRRRSSSAAPRHGKGEARFERGTASSRSRQHAVRGSSEPPAKRAAAPPPVPRPRRRSMSERGQPASSDGRSPIRSTIRAPKVPPPPPPSVRSSGAGRSSSSQRRLSSTGAAGQAGALRRSSTGSKTGAGAVRRASDASISTGGVSDDVTSVEARALLEAAAAEANVTLPYAKSTSKEVKLTDAQAVAAADRLYEQAKQSIRRKALKSAARPENCTFQPEITEKGRRSKSVDASVTRHVALYRQEQKRRQHIAEMRKQLQAEREKSGETFRPTVNASRRAKSVEPRGSVARGRMLYADAKERGKRAKMLKSERDAIRDATFQPKTNKKAWKHLQPDAVQPRYSEPSSGKAKKAAREALQQELTFQPKLDHSRRTLAATRRAASRRGSSAPAESRTAGSFAERAAADAKRRERAMQKRREERDRAEMAEATFAPKLSRGSRVLAELAGGRSDGDHRYPVEYRLHDYARALNERRDRMANTAEDEECTFRPNVRSRRGSSNRPQRAPETASLELYYHALRKQQKQRESSEALHGITVAEFRELDECSFAPQVSRKSRELAERRRARSASRSRRGDDAESQSSSAHEEVWDRLYAAGLADTTRDSVVAEIVAFKKKREHTHRPNVDHTKNLQEALAAARAAADQSVQTPTEPEAVVGPGDTIQPAFEWAPTKVLGADAVTGSVKSPRSQRSTTPRSPRRRRVAKEATPPRLTRRQIAEAEKAGVTPEVYRRLIAHASERSRQMRAPDDTGPPPEYSFKPDVQPRTLEGAAVEPELPVYERLQLGGNWRKTAKSDEDALRQAWEAKQEKERQAAQQRRQRGRSPTRRGWHPPGVAISPPKTSAEHVKRSARKATRGRGVKALPVKAAQATTPQSRGRPRPRRSSPRSDNLSTSGRSGGGGSVDTASVVVSSPPLGSTLRQARGARGDASTPRSAPTHTPRAAGARGTRTDTPGGDE